MKVPNTPGWLRGICGRGALAVTVSIMIVLAMATLGCSNAAADAEARVAEGDLAGAEAIYREVLREEPEQLEALEGLALVLMLQQRFDEALPIQERVIAADPEDVQTRVELGFNYLNHQGRPSDAVRVLEEAVALDGSAKHLTFLAQAQKAAGQLADAERSVRRAIETDPTYGHSYVVLIALLEEGGSYDEAAEIREQAAANGVNIEPAQSDQ